MNIFDAGFPKIIETITESFTYVREGAIEFGLYGLGIGILFILIGGFGGFFKRKSRGLRILTWCYYVTIPLSFGLAGAVMGGLHAADRFIEHQIPLTATPLTKVTFPSFQYYLMDNYKHYRQFDNGFAMVLNDFVTEIHFDYRSNDASHKMKVDIANRIVPEVTRWEMESIVESAIVYCKDDDKTGDRYGIHEDKTADTLFVARKLNIFRYPKSFWERVNIVAEAKCKKYFSHYDPEIISILLILLLFPIGEIILYRTVFRKKGY